MLVAYRQALRQLLLARVTLFLLAFGAGLSFGLAGYLPVTLDFTDLNPQTSYALRLVTPYILGLGQVLILLVAIFAAFRAGVVYRDELRDGSLLVMLSKPLTRSALILARWAAYLSGVAVFTFVCAIFHGLGVAAGTGFAIPAAVIFKGGAVIFGMALVLAFLFAGCAMVLGTFMAGAKASVAVLAVALLFPLSGLLPQSLAVSEVQRTPSGGRVARLLGYYKPPVNGLLGLESGAETVQRVHDDGVLALTTGSAQERAALLDFTDQLAGVGALAGRLDRNNATVGAFERLLAQKDELGANYLALFFEMYLYMPTGKRDPYPSFLPISFAQQALSLASYFTDSLYSREAQNRLAISADGIVGTEWLQERLGERMDTALLASMLENQLLFSKPRVSLDTSRQEELLAYMEEAGGAVYTVRYVRYLEPTFVLVAYLLVGAGLTGGSLLVLRRRNFA